MTDTPASKESVVVQPGIGIMIHVPAEGGRFIEFSGVAPVDCTPDYLDIILDKMIRAGARQHAKARLPALRAELEELQRNIAANEAIIAKRNVDFKARCEMREIDRKTHRMQMARQAEMAEAEHHNSSRRGAFDPTKNNQLKATQKQIDVLDEMEQKEANELAVQNSENHNVVLGDKIRCDKVRQLIMENRLVARGEDISGISDE